MAFMKPQYIYYTYMCTVMKPTTSRKFGRSLPMKAVAPRIGEVLHDIVEGSTRFLRLDTQKGSGRAATAET